jgi:hypothetical protein
VRKYDGHGLSGEVAVSTGGSHLVAASLCNKTCYKSSPESCTAMPTRYRVDDDKVAWRIADDEAVLLHADSSGYFGLNRIGTLLWVRLANAPMTLEQVTAWAESSLHDAPPGLPEMVSAFIDELLKFNLIEREENTGEVPRAFRDATTGGAAPLREPTTDDGAPQWEPPAVERFGELEKLILSGE